MICLCVDLVSEHAVVAAAVLVRVKGARRSALPGGGGNLDLRVKASGTPALEAVLKTEVLVGCVFGGAQVVADLRGRNSQTRGQNTRR